MGNPNAAVMDDLKRVALQCVRREIRRLGNQGTRVLDCALDTIQPTTNEFHGQRSVLVRTRKTIKVHVHAIDHEGHEITIRIERTLKKREPVDG